MYALKESDVAAALSRNPWELSNRVLYNLCEQYPSHRSRDEVLAKILLIGRVYAAAIERRRSKAAKNGAFYLSTVVPRVTRSRIDTWIGDAKAATPGTPAATSILVDTHSKVTKLFNRISEQNKRSLASKYLHFHVPNLFFIFDSRAVLGMSRVTSIVGRASRSDGKYDNAYRKFVEKCLLLESHCKREFGRRLSPRQLDNLLLSLALR